MGLFEKVKELIMGSSPMSDHMDVYAGGELTNQQIMNILVKRFEWEIEHRSVEGKMIYPMTFTIIMHNNDCQGRMVEMQMFIPKVVDKFYEIIHKYKDKYKDYTNPAKNWTFRIIPSMSENMELDGKEIKVEEGKVVIIASILDETDTNDANKSVNVSMPVDKSEKIKKMNINMVAFGKFVGKDEPITVEWMDPEEAVKGTSASLEASYIFGVTSQSTDSDGATVFHSDLSGLGTGSSLLQGLNFSMGGPKLAYKLNGQLYTYDFNTNECWVCGEGTADYKSNTFVVKSTNVKNPHLLIRKDVIENRYYTAAFAPATVELNTLPLSTLDKPVWTPLENNVNINMNGFVVRFINKN